MAAVDGMGQTAPTVRLRRSLIPADQCRLPPNSEDMLVMASVARAEIGFCYDG